MNKRLSRRHGGHGGHGILSRWMGLVSKSRVFRGCFFLIFLFSFFSCGGSPDDPSDWREAEPLYKIYENDFLLGNVISFPRDTENDRFILLKRHFNTVTPENHMKPENIAPSSRPADNNWVYRWNSADDIVDTARVNGMNVVGHTLIWHSQTPSWLTTGTRTEVLGNLNKYIADVAGHFKGKLIAWDVVNEAMKESNNISASDAMNWSSCLRDSGWKTNIGPDYIEKAFLAAREADPDAKRYYNDYNLNNPNKRDAVFNMVEDINGRYPKTGGRPLIEGIGMQTHHHLGTDPETVKDAIKKFALLGVEIAISEMDIQAAGDLPKVGIVTWGDKAAQDQAVMYATLFKIFKENYQVISRVTFWGIDDDTSWIDLENGNLKPSNRRAYPTLLNGDYSLKPAFFAVMDPSRYE